MSFYKEIKELKREYQIFKDQESVLSDEDKMILLKSINIKTTQILKRDLDLKSIQEFNSFVSEIRMVT